MSYLEGHGNRRTGQCLHHSPSFVRRRSAFERDNSDNPQLPPNRYRRYSADNKHRTGTGGTVQIIITGQVQIIFTGLVEARTETPGRGTDRYPTYRHIDTITVTLHKDRYPTYRHTDTITMTQHKGRYPTNAMTLQKGGQRCEPF